MPKKGKQSLLLHVIALLPPLLIVLFYPGVFLSALTYAGIICLILLALLPILMVWRGRYQLPALQGQANHYQVKGGKGSLILALIATIILLGIASQQL